MTLHDGGNMLLTKNTRLVELDAVSGRFTCPDCGRPDRAVTATGLIWGHKSKKGEQAECQASGALVYTEPLSGAELVIHAEALGRSVHEKDKDKVGDPYWKHLKGVADGVEVLAGFHAHAIATAWLHDVVEDHPSMVSFEKLLKWGYPQEVVDAVEAVTKKSGEEQGLYLQRIVDAGETAMLTKLADLMHNTRFDRLEAVAKVKGDSVRTRLLKKYTPAKARLMLELGIIQTVEGQELATKPKGTASGGSGWSSENADGSSSYSGSSLITGDWPAGWSAPVDKKLNGGKVGTTRYLLIDGSTKVADYNTKYKVWTKSFYSKKGKDWTPPQEKPSSSKKPSHVVKKAATDPNTKRSTKGIESVPQLRAVNLAKKVPELAAKAPRSVCGKCGEEVYQITSHFWKHLEIPADYHTPTKPTPDRAKTLLEEGLVSWDENGHSLVVTGRLDSTRVAWECVCGGAGEAADIFKYASYHGTKPLSDI